VEVPAVETQMVVVLAEGTPRAVEVPAVETQTVVVLAEGTPRAVEVPAVVARRPQGARQPRHASTTKIKTEIGVTRHQQKDGALDYFFESCDSYLICNPFRPPFFS
jgi:hypothetical protein